MIFNGIEKPYITVMRGRERPFFASDDGREIKVPIFIEYNGFSHFESLKEEIAVWLKHDYPKPLQFKDDPDRLYFAKVTDIETDNTQRFGTDATLHFHCESKYSVERKIQINNTLIETISGHKSTFWKTKTTFATNQIGYEIIFKSPGKTELRDIGKIKLNYSFIAGDVLVIDYSKRKVTVNGSDITNAVVILQSNFMELPIGQVEFSANHITEFYYNERFY